MSRRDLLAEWLETDGRMGFASGTVSGRRTRRYHGLLLVQTPAGRVMLVSGVEVWLETPAGTFGLSTQEYPQNMIQPRGEDLLTGFELSPWPTWEFQTPSGHRVRQECFISREQAAVILRWKKLAGAGPCQLHVKPLLSGRDYHCLQRRNDAFRFDAEIEVDSVRWQPYADRPRVLARSNARYEHRPEWFERLYYSLEAERGMDKLEDLAAPGEFHFEDFAEEALLIFAAEAGGGSARISSAGSLADLVKESESAERNRRESLGGPLEQAADAYVVRRGESRTIIAGYPWFTDWGRDTFISLRGLCLATGRLDVAEEILCSWAETVSEGMLPNRFPDHGEQPEYNSVDASLWYAIAVGEFVEECHTRSYALSPRSKAAFKSAISQILAGYRDGTRYNIRMEEDGLIAAGEAGQQLTWMDAKVGDWVVTPRIGKPVEIQALWINALGFGYDLIPGGEKLFDRAFDSFRERFWNEDLGCLYDVVDCDHQPGVVDDSIRPNQIFAVGGLPQSLFDGAQARRIVDAVEKQLWTPLGLRSLSPGDPHYRGRYEGDVWERDGAYHQGTVWCWLMGPFVEAWVRVRGSTEASRNEAREKFLPALEAHLNTAGLGHLSEIADGNPPHAPRGCPFQAWSLGEYLRLTRRVLG